LKVWRKEGGKEENKVRNYLIEVKKAMQGEVSGERNSYSRL
jgi:hypothetical protein